MPELDPPQKGLDESELSKLIEEAQGASPLQEPQTLPDRVTVAGFLHYQSQYREAFQIDLGHEELLEYSDQVFYRSLTVGEQWQSAIPERCWFPPEEIGIVVLRNDVGRFQVTQQVPKGTIEIDIGGNLRSNFLLVPPKACQYLRCTHPAMLRLRAREGRVPYTVYVLPG